MRNRWWSVMTCAALLAMGGAAAAQETGGEAESGTDTDLSTREAVGRTLTTAAEDVPPTFIFWQSDEHDAFIKPVLQMTTLLVTYVPHSDVNEELANRVSGLMLARFGLEGQLFEYVTFRSVFERDLGFSLDRNGPVGTSIWEGTASLQALENYIRLSRWGLSLAGGIVPDPASVDYVSENVLDTFGNDPYMYAAFLVTGLNTGQGVLLNYNWRWLTAGLSYTGGNPLTTSLAFGFGGDVSTFGTLFQAPLRAFSNGLPGSDIHVNTISPSITFESDVFDIRTAAQFYFVDVDVTSEDDQEITGYNLRATMQVKLLDDMLRFFASGAIRKNEQLAIPDVTTTKNDYEGLIFGGGADFRWGRFGIGGNYYWHQSQLSSDPVNEIIDQYVNIGMTYWLWDPFVSVGARYGRSMRDFDNVSGTEPVLKATDGFFLSMRLLI